MMGCRKTSPLRKMVNSWPELHPVLLGQVHVDPVALHRDHQALDGRERRDDVLDHEAEGRADLIRRARRTGR